LRPHRAVLAACHGQHLNPLTFEVDALRALMLANVESEYGLIFNCERLVLKLAALGVILLMPKTHLYLSDADLSKTQTAYERPVCDPATHPDDVNSRGYVALTAEGTQPKSSSCSAKPELDTMAVHATDTSPKGSHG
jgi:hypothetical protein